MTSACHPIPSSKSTPGSSGIEYPSLADSAGREERNSGLGEQWGKEDESHASLTISAQPALNQILD